MAKLTIKIELREFVYSADKTKPPAIVAFVTTEPDCYTETVKKHWVLPLFDLDYDKLGAEITDEKFDQCCCHGRALLPFPFDEKAAEVAKIIKAHDEALIKGLKEKPRLKDFYNQFDEIKLKVNVKR